MVYICSQLHTELLLICKVICILPSCSSLQFFHLRIYLFSVLHVAAIQRDGKRVYLCEGCTTAVRRSVWKLGCPIIYHNTINYEEEQILTSSSFVINFTDQHIHHL